MSKTAAGILLLLIGLISVPVLAQSPPDSSAATDVPAAEAEPSTPDSVSTVDSAPTTNSPSISYWGPASPDPGSTTLVRFTNPSRPVWESVVYWPVRIASYPLALTVKGIGGAIEGLDDAKVIYKIEHLLAPRRGPFGVLLDFRAGGISGIGGGFTAEHTSFLKRGNLFRLHAEATLRGDRRVNLGVRLGSPEKTATEVGLGYRVRPYASYYGVGPGTDEDAKSFYNQESLWAGASHRRSLGGGVHVQGDLLRSSIAAGAPGDKEEPAIEEEFLGALPLGYGFHSYGWTVGAQLSHENGLGPGRATHGGLRRIRASRFIGDSVDEAAFWSFRGEAQQYLTLFYPYRVLALRGVFSWIESSEGKDVPFQRLLSNDDPDLLRGYPDFRFRDRRLAILSAEYRWPLWTNKTPGGSGLDLYLLSDAGQVFHDSKELGGGNLTFSYGGGLRLESSTKFKARLELAWSEEGMQFRFRGDQIFQFLKGSLFFGRDPVPDR